MGVQLVAPRRSLLSRMPDLLPPVMAGAATLLATVSLMGWQFRLAALRKPLGGFMAPNTALCILALSGAVVLLRWRDRRIIRATGVFFAAFTTALCSVNLYEHLSDTSTGLTQIFFHHRLSDWDLPTVPGRFAPNAAIALILLSVSIMLGYFRKRRELAQNMTGMALLLSVLAIIGHAYDISAFYNLRIQNYMAVSTALAFLCLGVGTLMAIIPDGWMAMILRSDAAGMLSRRVLFITYITIPLLGYIAVAYERNNWVSSKVGISLVVLASLLILTSTVIRSAREIRTLERERVLTEDRLREAEKLAATGRLAATLAHEVNNPLEAVMNLLYLLGNEAGLNENSKEFLKLAEEELLRVTHITRQTLAFYREPSSPIPVQLGDQVQQVLRVFQPKLREKRVDVQFSSSATAEYVIHAGEFKQIVTNLLANAIDAVSRDGVISIRVRPTRDWSTGGETGFRITIADNGTGISRTDRKKLFQPFFITKGQRGTGLGLWVTQGLVTKHGGRLRMHSCTRTQYRGTTFSIFFPGAWQAAQVEEKAAAFRNAG